MCPVSGPQRDHSGHKCCAQRRSGGFCIWRSHGRKSILLRSRGVLGRMQARIRSNKHGKCCISSSNIGCMMVTCYPAACVQVRIWELSTCTCVAVCGSTPVNMSQGEVGAGTTRAHRVIWLYSVFLVTMCCEVTVGWMWSWPYYPVHPSSRRDDG